MVYIIVATWYWRLLLAYCVTIVMTEQMKSVLKELNEVLGTKYDLIKYDSLDEKQRLQLLIDLLVYFNAGSKVDVGEEEAETVSLQLLEMLSNVKYRPCDPAADPPAFRARLLHADPKLILSILSWLLHNKEQVRNTAYLARYLKLPDIPADVARAAGVAELLDIHRHLLEEFKEVHRRTRLLAADDSSGTEIVDDIKEMAVERDIVIKRLESVQVNLTEVQEREELLSAGRTLRLQQERASELANQHEVQQNQLKAIGDQLKRYLNVFYGQSSAPKSAADVIKHLREEIQLNEYLVKEKLPGEVSALQQQLSILQQVASEPALTRADLVRVQEKVGKVNGETEALVAEKLASREPAEDKLKPFRQQAALIRRNKEAAAERVHAHTEQLREHEATLAALTAQVRQLLGDTVLRGEELRKYVNTLRNKSSLYKRQRATLASYKVEAGILTRSLYIVSAADPTVEVALLNHKKLRVDEPAADTAQPENSNPPDLTKRSLHDLSQMVAQTAQTLSEVRQNIQPLAEELKPIRSKYQTVQQQFEQKKRVYEATSINLTSQMEPLHEKVKKLKDELSNKEEEWKTLRQKITKSETLQETVAAELRNSMQSPRKPSKMENLQKKIVDMETIVRSLEENQHSMSARAGAVEEQTQQWGHVLQLLECKMAAGRARAANAQRGHFTITNKSQTLTLQ